jgi:hypothetical protein
MADAGSEELPPRGDRPLFKRTISEESAYSSAPSYVAVCYAIMSQSSCHVHYQ